MPSVQSLSSKILDQRFSRSIDSFKYCTSFYRPPASVLRPKSAVLLSTCFMMGWLLSRTQRLVPPLLTSNICLKLRLNHLPILRSTAQATVLTLVCSLRNKHYQRSFLTPNAGLLYRIILYPLSLRRPGWSRSILWSSTR